MEHTNECGQNQDMPANNFENTQIEPIYNQGYDFVVFRSDILHVTPGRWYKLVITFEEGNGASRFTPTVTVPKKDGYIKITGHKRIFMLSTCNDQAKPIYEMQLMTKTGNIDISYHYEINDHRGFPFWGSSKMLRRLGMRRDILAPQKNRYYCTDEHGERFDCYIFTVEWEAVD